MNTHKITDVKAINAELVTKLHALEIRTVEDFLAAARDPKRLKTVVEKTGLTPEMTDRLVKIASLSLVDGVKPQYAEMLYWAGVDSVEKLRELEPAVLHRKLTEVNIARSMNATVPQLAEVAKWKTAEVAEQAVAR